jgi:integrase
LQREYSRHGKATWVVRFGYGPRVRIKAPYGTPEFDAEVDAAIKGTRPPVVGKVRTGSLQWLYDRYRETTAWTSDLSAATRRQRENIFKHVMAKSGSEPFGAIKRSDIAAGRDRRRETPAQARNFLDAMRGLFRWALEAQHVTVDPTAGVHNPGKIATEGFKAWDMEHVHRYIARWPLGTMQYVWLHVLLYIGCRRGDAVTLGKQHVRNGVVRFVTEKGRTKELIRVARRIEPELAEAIAAGPCGDLAFICGERGQPLIKESFGNAFKDACVAAGIVDRSAHGLRKLSAAIWAERGATENELMALFGWKTPSMAALYTKEANREAMSLNAHDRCARKRTASEHPMPAPKGKVRASGRKR